MRVTRAAAKFNKTERHVIPVPAEQNSTLLYVRIKIYICLPFVELFPHLFLWAKPRYKNKIAIELDLSCINCC